MLPTHAVVGLALAAPLVYLRPALAPAALAGGLLGGILPDFDLYWGHRRTLHYPTVYTLLVPPAAVVALLFPGPLTVGVAFSLLGAAVHCRMDRYGGGLELRPWEETSDRAVYDHVRGTWREPKRAVDYDGSPGDLLLSLAVGVPLLFVLDGVFRALVAASLAVAVVYVALRRWLARLAPVVFAHVPGRLAEYVPERYRS